MPSHSMLEVMDFASVSPCFTKRQVELWSLGSAPKRHRCTEITLKKLTIKKKLYTVRLGRELVYSMHHNFEQIRHSLAVTECLVRLWRSRMEGIIIAEKYFRGLGSVPEFGILYPNKTMLLCEFCTRDNFLFSGLIRSKLATYKSNLNRIEEKFNSKATVVFICDVPHEMIKPAEYFFCDYETFLKVPLGKALTEPICLWKDGKRYPIQHA